MYRIMKEEMDIMSYSKIYLVMAIIVLVGMPFASDAYQIGPNPNTGTITIDSCDIAENGETFDNTQYGYIYNFGSLTNNGIIYNGYLKNEVQGRLTNYGTINNGKNHFIGGFWNYGRLDNYGLIFTSQDRSLHNYGTLRNYSGGRIEIGSLVNETGRSLTNYGAMSIDALNNSGTLGNYGSLNFRSGGLNNTGTFRNYGTINNEIRTIDNSGTFINIGTIGDSVFGNYRQIAGLTKNMGTMRQYSIEIDGGILSGTGTITAITPSPNGKVTIGTDGIINPGNPAGTLTINGTFSSSGTLLIDIAGLANGQYSVLKINGDAIFRQRQSRI